jgi:hypothetical protein
MTASRLGVAVAFICVVELGRGEVGRFERCASKIRLFSGSWGYPHRVYYGITFPKIGGGMEDIDEDGAALAAELMEHIPTVKYLVRKRVPGAEPEISGSS